MPRRGFIHEIESRERRGRWFPALAGLVAIALIASSWVGLFGFLSANAAYGTFEDVTDEYVPEVESMPLDFPDISRTSRVYAATGEQLAELHDGRIAEPTPIEEIPELVINAVLAAEDEDFYEHEGVDFEAIASAAIDNILYDDLRGGSTITQQLVKQNFVGDEISIRRKITEAFVSAELERRYTKDEILEFYLNSVFFGANAYGVTAAAEEYFDKDLNELTVAEAATLASLIRNPTLYNPREQPATVTRARNATIDQMLENGWITEFQAEVARRTPLRVEPRRSTRGPADHVVAEVVRRLLDMENSRWDVLGETREERKKAIFGCPADDESCTGGGGLRIETTIDLEQQRAANRILEEWLPVPGTEENLELCRELADELALDTEEKIQNYAAAHTCAPTGAIATVDNQTGAVLVMASGLPFETQQFDLAVQGRRNPGSAFKPFALVTALRQGESLNSYWDGSSPQTLECPYVCSARGNEWEVRNAGASYGMITLDRATSSSVNTVYAQLALRVGPEEILDTAQRMGITSLDEQDAVPSIALGSGAVSPLEMASAYSNFATNGRWAEPYLVARIVDAEGDVLYEHEPQPTQVLEPEIFAAAREPLTRVPTSAGTAVRADLEGDRPQGGKTGTHQNYRDAWFVGFVPQYSTAVWVGYEAEQIPLENVVINGERYSRVFGGSVPAPIWAEFMGQLLEGVPDGEFPEAEDTEQFFEVPTERVPSVVGLTEGEAIARLRDQRLGASVAEVPSTEPEGTVIAQDPQPGVEIRQGTAVVIEVSTGDPPEAPVPGVLGRSYEEALGILRAFEEETGVRLEIVRRTVESSANPPGTVVGMSPAPRTVVDYGTQVVLEVVG